MKQIKCNIDSRWMWGLESACITVISPSGGYIRLDKWHMDKASDELRELVWRCVKAADSEDRSILLTVDEMQLLTTYPKASIYKAYKPKPKYLAQRKFDTYKKSSCDRNKCGCGGFYIIKDHGSWEGYYCKKCGTGGSRQKSSKFRR